MDFSSSLVSKTKTALHSAAAKAERVLIDIKSDFKSERECNGDCHRASKKASDDESDSPEKPNKVEHSRWKPANFGRRQDWQHRLMNMKKGRKWEDDIDEIKDLTSDNPAVDEYLNHVDLENSQEVKGVERNFMGLEDGSCASEVATITPSFVIKQLAKAIETGKKFKSLSDLLASAIGSSPAKERPGLSFSAVKSLVLREKEEKLTSELGDNEEMVALIHLLFNTEKDIPRRNNACDSATITTTYLPRDIHGAPPESFVVRLSEIVGSIKTMRKMASFWFSVVAELRRLWCEEQPVPLVPLDENPDLNYCLLHQQLQVINCCITRKKRHLVAVESLDTGLKEANCTIEDPRVYPCESSSSMVYARISNEDYVLRLGADHPSKDLTMLETGESVYSPVTQEGPILTEDLIRETEEFVLRTGSCGAGCSQLLSDMQAFKAANPGCILEDFIRWHSPPDWTDAESSDETQGSFDGGDMSLKRGQLSTRMQTEGNLWRELWETAKPLPAVKQTPLFDEDLAVDGILNSLEDISPSDLFEQLFVSVLSSSFAIAEATLATNSVLSKLFFECKEYVITMCQGDLSKAKIDDLCQVYETVETMLVRPEEALTIMKQSEETTVDEPKRSFLRINLNFRGKDKQTPNKSAPKEHKSDEKNTPLFSQIFDGKSSLFTRKQRKPSTSEAVVEPTNQVETDWTIV